MSCSPRCCMFAQGKACNVARAAEVRNLAAYAVDQLGTIDLWWVGNPWVAQQVEGDWHTPHHMQVGRAYGHVS